LRAARTCASFPAAAARNEVLAAAEAPAVPTAAAAAADAHPVVHAGVLAVLAAAESARLALDVAREVLGVALHLAVALVVRALVVVGLLGLGEEDGRLLGRGAGLVLRDALPLEDVARPLQLPDTPARGA
jgi:hypothetical protein